jgi:N-acetyl-gamma-glutamyl-phosphate reductase
MAKHRVAIYGASGYAGAELIRKLLKHPQFELVQVCAADHIGEPVASAHLNLEGVSSLRFEAVPAAPPKDLDVLLLALPHDASHRIVGSIASSSLRVIDLSGAFRVKSAQDYEKFYGHAHPLPQLLGQFVYGLPEITRQHLKTARFVASPGCFATCIQLGLLPLARAGLLSGSVHTVGLTGSSGSGATASVTTHHPTRALNLRTYRPLQHPHQPEIVESLTAQGAKDLALSFVPVSAPLSRGIFATSFVELPVAAAAGVPALYDKAYDDEPFIRIPKTRLPEVIAVAGSNYAEVGVVLGAATGTTQLVTVFSALDNLVKGGAGQAIQSLNLMFGLDETTALLDPGGFP